MRKVKFEDVATRVNTREDKDNTSLLYYVGGDHIESGEMVVHNKGLIEGSTIGPMFYFGFKKGDILLVSRNPHLRKAAMVNFDGICSEKTFVIGSKDENVLLQRYLAVVVQTESFWNYCEEHKSGGVNFFVNWSTLAKYEFELPDIEEQRIISDKVWAAYEVKECYRKLISATDELVKSRFFEQFADLPFDHKWKDVLTIINGKAYGEEYKVSGTYPICGSGGIMGYGEKKMCNHDSIILGRKGNIDKPIYMSEDYWIVDTAFCLSPNTELIHPIYLYYWCKQFDFQKLNKQAVLPSLTRTDLEQIDIQVPEMAEQLVFVEIVRQADKSKFELKQAIEKIDKVMRALLQ